MKLGIFDGNSGPHVGIDDYEANARAAAEAGFDSYWLPQIFGMEALTLLAVVGREVPGIALGTSVVPTYPRHPITMAAEALTTQKISGGRLHLGIGLSHQMVIEGMFGLSFDRPAAHMEEYLAALTPLLRGEAADATGERISAHASLEIGAEPVPLLVAALGPLMLRIAAEYADGTITWMTGPKTLSSHTIPTLAAAREELGKGPARVTAALPVAVTADVAGAKERAAKAFSIYGMLPSYRAMLDREGAEGPADVAIIGSADEVSERIGELAEIGVTDFAAVEFLSGEEGAATREVLTGLL